MREVERLPYGAPEVVETERLKLRQFTLDDFPWYANLCADTDTMRYLGGRTFDRTEAWRHLAFIIGHWKLLGFGHWAVEEKATGSVVGRVGFLNPADWPGIEVGWTIDPAHRGRGYAREAAARVLDLAFDDLQIDHIISCIHPDNTPSIRVAEYLGESVEGETVILGSMPVLIYGISSDTWRMRRGSRLAPTERTVRT